MLRVGVRASVSVQTTLRQLGFFCMNALRRFMFIVFMALLFLGIPVVFAVGTASLIWLLTMNPVGIPASVAAQTMMSQMLSFALIAMPGFLFVGRMMNTSGVTDRLLKFSVAVV